jgi:D-alanyl-D-alanine carboxypeptidase/D-alanyl-D-alanine-endopeptidase (penicillin-binding protein 4)
MKIRTGTLTVAVAIGLLIGTQPAGAAVPASVSDTFDSILSKPLYAHSTWGWSVRDAATGETLYEHNSQLQFVPGSIIKSYSSAAVLDAYGSDYRFHTPVHRLGHVRRGVLRGDLALVGSGDFSFGLRNRANGTLDASLAFEDFDHNEAGVITGVKLVDGDPLAAVRDLARQVRDAGIRRVTGDVIVDNRLFKPFTDWNSGRIDSIWVNENLIDIKVSPTSPGHPADVEWRPHTAAFHVANHVTTGPAGSPSNIEVDHHGGVVEVSGRIAADSDPELDKFRIPDPASFARTAFVEALRRAGVRVEARAVGPNREDDLPARDAYPDGSRVADYVSPPLSQYVKVVLKVSYNRGADLFGCLAAVAAGSRDCNDAAGLMRDTFTPLGVSPQSTFVFDGAGSIDDAKTTPADMSAFYLNVANEPYGDAIFAGLPVMGVNGSLATTLVNSPAAGHVFAKTGTRGTRTPYGQTLLAAQNLVGYIDTAGGRRLAYSVNVNNVPLQQFTDVLTVFSDQGTMSAALQQGL